MMRCFWGVLAAGLVGLCCVGTGDAQTRVQTLQPEKLPENVEIFNSASGLYNEVIQNVRKLDFQLPNAKYTDFAPLSGTPVNLYGRVSWHSLEPTEGNYDFSILDAVLESCFPGQQSPCLAKGGRFGFRIMALNPQVLSDTNVTTGADGYPVYTDVPAYLETGAHGWLLPVNAQDKTQGHYFIPDWNDPYFLNRIDALLGALGHRYDGDPRLGWIDIGLYGSWGEWHTGGLPDEVDYKGSIPYAPSSAHYSINTQAWAQNHGGQPGAYQAGTAASKNAIIDAHVEAFPETQLLMLTDDGEGLCHALDQPGPSHIGMRRDSLGAGDFTYQFPASLPDCDTPSEQTMIAERWKSAPFIVEPYGNGSSPTFPCQTFTVDAATGVYDLLEQIPAYHVAAVKNASFCTGTWSALSSAEQEAVLWAGVHVGYRLAPTAVVVGAAPHLLPARGNVLAVRTYWANAGTTPAYDAWTVEFSLWMPQSSAASPVARFASGVDLRQVLPSASGDFAFADTFAMPTGLPPGQYELRMRVVDARGYMQPMQLALQNRLPAGGYVLGSVVLP